MAGEKFSVAVLAGGKSSRMGQDKAVLPWDNSDILNSLLVKLLPLSNDVIVVSNTARKLIKAAKQASDIFFLKGPLSGIHAGLVYADHQIVFVTACDTPFLKAETIPKIVEAVGNADAAVVVHKGKIEPLVACYKKSCIKVIEGLVTNGKYSVMSLLDNINWIAINYLDELDDDYFMNINTYSDYEKAKLLFERIKQPSSNVSGKGER